MNGGGDFNPYTNENGFNIDLSDPLTSLNPSSDDSSAINLLASLSQSTTNTTPIVSETDYKTYSLTLLFNGVVVEPSGSRYGRVVDAEGFERSPGRKWKISLGGGGVGGGRAGTVEVLVEWKEVEGGTGEMKGQGKEGYEIFVRRG